MLDLKSKLLAAGLVTKEQIDKVEQEKLERKRRAKEKALQKKPAPPLRQSSGGQAISRPEFKKTPPPSPRVFLDFNAREREKHVRILRELSKGEQYDVVRRWVKRNRLDHEGAVQENCERYFFQTVEGAVSWLTLDARTHSQVTDGQAAIMAYMSNHGLVHCVMPKEIAEDVAEIFPLWLRVLTNHPKAGQIEKISQNEET